MRAFNWITRGELDVAVILPNAADVMVVADPESPANTTQLKGLNASA